MTDRIKRMQAALKVDKFPFCAEKAKLVIESWKKHEGLPAILSRAHATADYLDHRTIYVDEDEQWIWGLFYCNPNDRRLVVNDRVGGNTSVNLARPAGKILMGVVAALLICLPLLGVWLVEEERAPVELALTDEALIASHGGDRYEISRDEITGVELLSQMPSGLIRVAGTAMDTVRKGQYAAAGYTSLTLCLDPREGPWLLVTTQEGKHYLFGAPGVTETVARQLGFPGTAPAGQ